MADIARTPSEIAKIIESAMGCRRLGTYYETTRYYCGTHGGQWPCRNSAMVTSAVISNTAAVEVAVRADEREKQIEKDAGIAGVRWDAMFETDQGYRVAKLTGERVALAIRDQLAGDKHE